MHIKAGNNHIEGFLKMDDHLDQAKKVNTMMKRMDGDHLDRSKN